MAIDWKHKVYTPHLARVTASEGVITENIIYAVERMLRDKKKEAGKIINELVALEYELVSLEN